MQQPTKAFNPYLISLCKDQSLVVERSKRFYEHPVESLAHLAQLVSLNRFWSPIVWRGGHNKKVNFVAAYYMVLDLDDGAISLEEAKGKLRPDNYAALIYTTSSHQKIKNGAPPCDRFRIVIPFSSPITDSAKYEYNMRLWIKRYSADRACGSAASAFKPAMAGVELIDGDNIVDPVNVPPPTPRKKSSYVGSRQIPSWLHAKLHFGVPGERHRGLFSVCASLSAFGFTESETINIVSQSPLWEQGPDDDSRRTARDGWRTGQKG